MKSEEKKEDQNKSEFRKKLEKIERELQASLIRRPHLRRKQPIIKDPSKDLQVLAQSVFKF